MSEKLVKLGRFISLILRHSPETIGIKLDENGWADVEELIILMNKNRRKIDIDTLKEIVETNNKKRYEFSDDFKKIRACQGHSINVDVELEQAVPPEFLYHGTAVKNIESIKKDGIKKASRQHVHLSSDYNTAYNVGKRHGKPYIIKVLSGKMGKDRKKFYISKNEVWLSDDIETEYLVFEE